MIFPNKTLVLILVSIMTFWSCSQDSKSSKNSSSGSGNKNCVPQTTQQQTGQQQGGQQQQGQQPGTGQSTTTQPPAQGQPQQQNYALVGEKSYADQEIKGLIASAPLCTQSADKCKDYLSVKTNIEAILQSFPASSQTNLAPLALWILAGMPETSVNSTPQTTLPAQPAPAPTNYNGNSQNQQPCN